MDEDIIIFENDITQDDMDAINELMAQLSQEAQQLEYEAIQEVMRAGFIFTSRDNSADGAIIGMASLIPARKLFAYFGTVEDVVVHERYRGKGIGKKLTKKIIEKAGELGMMHLDLTSNPTREAANKLYKSLGFELRDTNYYRFKIL